MANDEDWIPAIVLETRKFYPVVSENVIAQIEALLKGELREHQLHSAELTEVAKTLLELIVPT